jgi:formylglycine-generating enzyme required for sulfatase activity
MMGNPDVRRERNNDEAPQHKVTLTRGFWMSETEITQAQWVAVMGTNPSNFIDDNKPVERVSWNDISEPSSGFLAKLNAAHPESIFRLPTEAEWEYACRAGTTSPYYWGEDTRKVLLENHAWYYSNSNSSTHPVAKKAPNTWGLYDMSGNVREWCADWYAYYSGNATSNPRGPSTGTKRVNRGGCWVEDTSTCRASDRYSDMPEYKYFGNGFRIVKQ